MGFREALKELWTSETEGVSIEDKLEKAAITMMADKKFAQRQKLLAILLEDLQEKIDANTPLDYVEKLKELLDNVHSGVINLAAPYYQTLDNLNYHRLMRGWSAWYALGTLWIATVKQRIKGVEKREEGDNGASENNKDNNGTEEDKANEQEPDGEQTQESENYMLFPEITEAKDTIIDIKTLVQGLASVLYLHIFQDAYLILLQSYSAEDVREKWAVVIQSLSPSISPRNPNPPHIGR